MPRVSNNFEELGELVNPADFFRVAAPDGAPKNGTLRAVCSGIVVTPDILRK